MSVGEVVEIMLPCSVTCCCWLATTPADDTSPVPTAEASRVENALDEAL